MRGTATFTSTPGAATSIELDGLENEAGTVVVVGGRHREDVRVLGRVRREVEAARVAARGDDDRALADRGEDRVAQHGDVRGAAETEVDHARARTRGREDPGGDRGQRESVLRAGVPLEEARTRVDAAEGGAARPDQRADGSAVEVATRGDLLRVEGDRVRPPVEFGMAEVESGVDDEHPGAGARRHQGAGVE